VHVLDFALPAYLEAAYLFAYLPTYLPTYLGIARPGQGPDQDETALKLLSGRQLGEGDVCALEGRD
jgi:hypothetical protein